MQQHQYSLPHNVPQPNFDLPPTLDITQNPIFAPTNDDPQPELANKLKPAPQLEGPLVLQDLLHTSMISIATSLPLGHTACLSILVIIPFHFLIPII